MQKNTTKKQQKVKGKNKKIKKAEAEKSTK